MRTQTQSGNSSTSGSKGLFDNAFSFSIPIQVLSKEAIQSRGFATTPTVGDTPENEGECAYSSIAAVQQRALKCVESNLFAFPIKYIKKLLIANTSI